MYPVIPIVTDQTKPAHSFVYDGLIVNSSPNDQVKEKGGGEDIELSLVAGWSWWCVQRYLEWSLKDVSGWLGSLTLHCAELLT